MCLITLQYNKKLAEQEELKLTTLFWSMELAPIPTPTPPLEKIYAKSSTCHTERREKT
jgi:hypothetical protein